MASLIAHTPCQGLLPLRIGGLTLTEAVPDAITSIQPYAGRAAALSDAMRAAHGVGFPAPGRSTAKSGARVIWTGIDQAFLIGPAPDPALAAHAALTDQTDAWAVMRLKGDAAEAVLARLVPVDLSPETVKRGHALRSALGHMAAILGRTGASEFEIMVFRSMARSAVHELDTAMRGVAARAEAGN